MKLRGYIDKINDGLPGNKFVGCFDDAVSVCGGYAKTQMATINGMLQMKAAFLNESGVPVVFDCVMDNAGVKIVKFDAVNNPEGPA